MTDTRKQGDGDLEVVRRYLRIEEGRKSPWLAIETLLVSRLVKRVEEAEYKAVRYDESLETFKNVMDEKCAGDEIHCTCVPHLRQGIEALKAENLEQARLLGMARKALKSLKILLPELQLDNDFKDNYDDVADVVKIVNEALLGLCKDRIGEANKMIGKKDN
jgi:hypothetical protein